MTAASRQERLARAVMFPSRGQGEPATYTPAGASTGTPVVVAILPRTDPIWSGGEITVTEHHYTGYLLVGAMLEPPENGDGIVTDDARYVIDQEPLIDRGLWVLVLRKLAP